jgi:hypothetical protein
LTAVTIGGNSCDAQDLKGRLRLPRVEGGHGPRHVHVFRHGRLVVKWDLENRLPIVGSASRRLRRLIDELVKEGRL